MGRGHLATLLTLAALTLAACGDEIKPDRGPYNPLDDPTYARWYDEIHTTVPSLGLSRTHVANNPHLRDTATWRGGFVGTSRFGFGDPVTGTTRITLDLDRVRTRRLVPHGQLAVTHLRIHTPGAGWQRWRTGRLPIYNLTVGPDGSLNDTVTNVSIEGNFHGARHQAIAGELSIFDNGPYDGLEGTFSGRR